MYYVKWFNGLIVRPTSNTQAWNDNKPVRPSVFKKTMIGQILMVQTQLFLIIFFRDGLDIH